jgi:hypothetical protein
MGEEEMTGWQDIASAPRDGTEFLGFAFDGRTFYGVVQIAVDPPDQWFWEYAIRPTHWMPLPDPPKQD